MKTFKTICAQGDILIRKIDALPDGLQKHEPNGASIIVTHSETGHHHVMEADRVEMFVCKDNALECFLVVHRQATLEHLRPHDTHEAIQFEPGIYHVRRQREYSPEGWRRVAD